MPRNVFGCESPESRLGAIAREREMTPTVWLDRRVSSVWTLQSAPPPRELVKFKACLVDARSRP
jgi:hypothetical protein